MTEDGERQHYRLAYFPGKRMRAILSSTIVLLIFASLLPAQRGNRRSSRGPEKMQNFTFEDEVFQSKSVDRRMPFGIYLPSDYDDKANAEKQWPLVIWLHWIEVKYVKSLRYAVGKVMMMFCCAWAIVLLF